MNKATIVLGFLIILMSITAPSREEHVNYIEERFVHELQSELKPKSGAEMIGAGFASMLGGGVIKALLKGASFNHYVVCSTLTIPSRSSDRDELLSVGAFGQVFMIKELDEGK